jgi:hypothetical protein
MKIEIRDSMEIQRAHDMLHGIVIGEIPKEFFTGKMQTAINIATDVLCWVLKHEHNEVFIKNLIAIEAHLAKCDIFLVDAEEEMN